MTDATKNKKKSSLKVIVIVAFLGLIALVAWLSIQLVNNAPGAFTSLASIAESVNQQTSVSESVLGEPTRLVLASNKNLINTQETIDISWDSTGIPGTYTFSYVCAEGVAIDIVDDTNAFQNISCDTNYDLGNVDSLTLLVESEKTRFENISYNISFLTTSDVTPSASGIASFMVVNSAIPSDTIAQDEIIATEVIEENSETEVVVTEEVTTPVVVVPPAPVFTFAIPTSDPNGRVDLSTQFIATGIIVGNSFFPQAITRDENGAIEFEVKNFGTKTSDDWTFTITMPNGSLYESATQRPLKPNERAVLTVGFLATDTSRHIFGVTLNGETDSNTLNDTFVQAVTFAR